MGTLYASKNLPVSTEIPYVGLLLPKIPAFETWSVMMTEEEQDIIFIRGERVYLRPPTKDDIPAFLRWMNDPEVNHFAGAFHPFTATEQAEWIDRLHKCKDSSVILVIMEAQKRVAIGTVSINEISWKDRRAVTGIAIGDKAFWGKGYGTEATMLLLNYAFNMLNLRKITARIFRFNERSKRSNEKCGYTVEAVLREEMFREGAYHDLLVMTVFKEHWMPIWNEFRKTHRV